MPAFTGAEGQSGSVGARPYPYFREGYPPLGRALARAFAPEAKGTTMAFKDLLVYLDSHPSARQRVDLACGLAVRYQAHLTGLYVVAPLVTPSYFDAHLPETVNETQQQRQKHLAATAQRLFHERTAAAGLADRAEWRDAEGVAPDIVSLHGRYADLIVVGQRDPQHVYESPSLLPQELIFGCGRPVLTVPFSGRFDLPGKHVLVGWNASREAARALADALPFLLPAQRITLLAVNPGKGAGTAGDAPAEDIARHLARHGIRAEALHVVDTEAETGEILLDHVDRLGCDLVVMGAYGHSRLRSLILGSLTTFVLGRMSIPVLMSH